MCGRFVQDINPALYMDHYRLSSAPAMPPRFNIAPSQQVAVVRQDASGAMVLSLLRWGLVPSWAKDINIGYKMINARSETVHEKPSFRQPLKSRRCIVPANGFYEWQPVGKEKVPHYIQRSDKRIMSLAGLWDQWVSPDGEVIESFTILTTDANELLKPIHHRMPVILDKHHYPVWLGHENLDPSKLFRPYPAEFLDEYVVSSDVNSPRNDKRENTLPV
jgi:putative SOS response-associated peptidase YedK